MSIEELPVEEPAGLLLEIPEIRRLVEPEREQELGFRSFLERPEALSKAWWRAVSARKRRPRIAKRHHGALDAA